MPVGDTHDVIGTIELEHNGRVYEIMRSIKYTCIGDKKVRASLPKATISFLQDDGQTKTEIGSTFDQNIERILPKSLSSYFFFGGERVGTISSRDDVEASVKGLMGLDVLSNAMTHLRGAIKKFKSGMDFSGDDRASQASSQLEDANQRLSNYQDELKNIEDQLDYYTGEQQKYGNLLKSNEQTAADQKNREKLGAVITSLEERIKDEKIDLVKAFSRDAFAFYSVPLLKNAIQILNAASDDTESIPEKPCSGQHYRGSGRLPGRRKRASGIS